MKTLSDVLHDADPAGYEPRSAHARAVTRATILSAPRPVTAARTVSRRRVLALAGVLGIASVAATRFAWRYASVDAVAAVRFEARLAGSKDAVVRNSDIARAEVVAGTEPGTFDINITFTPEGARKLRAATAGNVGKTIELLIDGKVVMAPVVRSPIPSTSGASTITGRYTRAEADRIVSGIVGR